ncbi:MAG: 50S ribosomal protein L10 [Lachnospiraceae bacterium]|nr:50S ribosomal protein L10 [Lachnospiraceae bacterium]MBP5254856.1 50S ribosomal protein L10 [Lachnospiraceae bacterium]
MAKIEEKKPIVQEICDVLKDSASAVLVDHRGLTVAEDTELRKTLRDAGIHYKVYKNTFMRFAVKGTPNEGLAQILEGPSALAVCKDDATKAASELSKFAKAHKKLEIKGGIVEGSFYDKDGILAVANIPSREVLIGRLLGSMQSPIANLARVIKQIAEKDSEPAA